MFQMSGPGLAEAVWTLEKGHTAAAWLQRGDPRTGNSLKWTVSHMSAPSPWPGQDRLLCRTPALVFSSQLTPATPVPQAQSASFPDKLVAWAQLLHPTGPTPQDTRIQRVLETSCLRPSRSVLQKRPSGQGTPKQHREAVSRTPCPKCTEKWPGHM